MTPTLNGPARKAGLRDIPMIPQLFHALAAGSRTTYVHRPHESLPWEMPHVPETSFDPPPRPASVRGLAGGADAAERGEGRSTSTPRRTSST